MKHRTIIATIVAACLAFSGVASAQTFRAGFGADIGVPSGASVGLVVHPWQDVLTLQPSLTYNGLGFGGRLSVKFDPMALAARLPVGVFLDAQGGFAEPGNIPGHSASLGYDYFNAYGGLRLGRATGFNWVIEAGPTYLSASTGNFQSLFNTSGVALGNPSVSGWVLPTFCTGFSIIW